MTRGRRRRVEANASLTITSMMDMFVIILLFLLVFFDPDAQPDPLFQLPASTATAPQSRGTSIRVKRDGIEVDGRHVLDLTAGELRGAARDGRRIVAVEGALAAARNSAAGEEAALRVECDKAVPWATLGDVLATAAAAGFDQYRLVVLSGGEAGEQPG